MKRIATRHFLFFFWAFSFLGGFLLSPQCTVSLLDSLTVGGPLTHSSPSSPFPSPSDTYCFSLFGLSHTRFSQIFLEKGFFKRAKPSIYFSFQDPQTMLIILDIHPILAQG